MPRTAVALLLLLRSIARISAQEGCDGYVWKTEDDGQGDALLTIQKTDAHGLEVGDAVFLHGMRDETGAAMDAVARLYEGNRRVGSWTSSRDESELQFQVHDLSNVPCTAANKCPSEGPMQRICVATGWRPSPPPRPPPAPPPVPPAPPPRPPPAPPPLLSDTEIGLIAGLGALGLLTVCGAAVWVAFGRVRPKRTAPGAQAPVLYYRPQQQLR